MQAGILRYATDQGSYSPPLLVLPVLSEAEGSEAEGSVAEGSGGARGGRGTGRDLSSIQPSSYSMRRLKHVGPASALENSPNSTHVVAYPRASIKSRVNGEDA